jgi:hypothetical protein
LSFVLSKNFVAISAVISPRKFCKVVVSKSSLQNAASESLLLPCAKILRQKLREFRAAFRLAATETLQTVACGKKAVNSAANHQPNKSLKGARVARWTRHCVARPLARR